MPLQSLALKVLSTRYADGHPLETCGLHQKKEKKRKRKKSCPSSRSERRWGGERASRRAAVSVRHSRPRAKARAADSTEKGEDDPLEGRGGV